MGSIAPGVAGPRLEDPGSKSAQRASKPRSSAHQSETADRVSRSTRVNEPRGESIHPARDFRATAADWTGWTSSRATSSRWHRGHVPNVGESAPAPNGPARRGLISTMFCAARGHKLSNRTGRVTSWSGSQPRLRIGRLRPAPALTARRPDLRCGGSLLSARA